MVRPIVDIDSLPTKDKTVSIVVRDLFVMSLLMRVSGLIYKVHFVLSFTDSKTFDVGHSFYSTFRRSVFSFFRFRRGGRETSFGRTLDPATTFVSLVFPLLL